MKKKNVLILITIFAVITLGIFILTYNNTIIGFGEVVHMSASGTKNLMPVTNLGGPIVGSDSRVYFIIEGIGIMQEDFNEKYEILSIELNGIPQKYSIESEYGKCIKIRIVPEGGYDIDNEIKIKLKNKNSNRIKDIKLDAKLIEVC